MNAIAPGDKQGREAHDERGERGRRGALMRVRAGCAMECFAPSRVQPIAMSGSSQSVVVVELREQAAAMWARTTVYLREQVPSVTREQVEAVRSSGFL